MEDRGKRDPCGGAHTDLPSLLLIFLLPKTIKELAYDMTGRGEQVKVGT